MNKTITIQVSEDLFYQIKDEIDLIECFLDQYAKSNFVPGDYEVCDVKLNVSEKFIAFAKNNQMGLEELAKRIINWEY